MIISLFGPDGVGKSTVAKLMQQKGWFVFSGTGVASWPDKTWHNELMSRGIDETVVGTDEHLVKKITKAHELARHLEKAHEIVVIDSDPFHKTLMHDAIKNRERFDELFAAAYPNGRSDTLHILLRLSHHDAHEAAIELQNRIHSRGSLAPFDPETIDESEAMIHACDQIVLKLSELGEKTATIYTDDMNAGDQIIDLWSQIEKDHKDNM